MTITLDKKNTAIQSERVSILPFDLGPVEGTKVNRLAVERRAATIPTRRKMKEEVKAFREACGPAHIKSVLATGEL